GVAGRRRPSDGWGKSVCVEATLWARPPWCPRTSGRPRRSSSVVSALSISPMRTDDLDEVVTIERASFGMPWSRGAFLYEIEQNRVARCWVLREDDRVAAYLCLWEIADELHVTNIAVHPGLRRRGLARRLLGAILEDGR